MAKLKKHIRKDMKKLSKQLNSKNGLAIRETFDYTLSLFGKKKENKPYFTLSAHGDYKISVAKLLVITLCAVSSVILLVLLVKSISESVKERRHRRELAEFYDINNEEIPF